MSQAEASADLSPPERLHPLMLVSGLAGSVRGVAGGYAGIAYLAATGRLETALILGGLLLVGALISLFLRWRSFVYRVGQDEVRIDSGVFQRTHRSIPFDRVQDVDITQGPLQRLLGLATVTFDTGGAAGKDEEGALNGIALRRADELREHVRSRRSGAVAGHAEAAPEEQRPVFAMDLRRVLTAGIFNFSLAIFAGLFGITQTLGDLVGFDPFERQFWVDLLASAGPLTDFVQGHRFGAAVAGLLLLLLVGLLTGVTRTIAGDYRFRLDRTGTGLRRRRGLLTLTDVTLPLRRVQAALVLSGPVRRFFGWHELRLQSLAQDEGGRGDHVVAPLAREAEVETILTEVGWRLAGKDAAWEPVSRAYLWTLVLGLSPLIVICTAALALLGLMSPLLHQALREEPMLAFAPLFVPVVGVPAVLLIAIIARWRAWRRTAFVFEGDALNVRTGWWRRRRVLLPLRNVQSVDIDENVLERWFGIASVTIGVAGGSGFSSHSIPALPREKASQVRTALLSRFA